MYVINTSRRKIKKIIEYLKRREIEFEETKMDDYILVREDPKSMVPSFLLSGAKVMEISLKESFRIYKDYGVLGEFLEYMKPKPPEVGQLVRIVGGQYKDLNLKGIVREVGKSTCGVETMVWGNLVKLKVGYQDVKVIGNAGEL